MAKDFLAGANMLDKTLCAMLQQDEKLQKKKAMARSGTSFLGAVDVSPHSDVRKKLSHSQTSAMHASHSPRDPSAREDEDLEQEPLTRAKTSPAQASHATRTSSDPSLDSFHLASGSPVRLGTAPSKKQGSSPLVRSGSKPGTSPLSDSRRSGEKQHPSPLSSTSPLAQPKRQADRHDASHARISLRKRFVSGDTNDQAWTVKRHIVVDGEDEDEEDASRFRHDKGVYWSTRKENVKKSLDYAKIAFLEDQKSGTRSRAGTSGSPHPSEPDYPGAPEELFRNFNEDASNVEKEIQSALKSLRMEHLSKPEADKERLKKEREEQEKKKLEAERAKARLAEKDARDPHKNIQLKLDFLRKYGMLKTDQQKPFDDKDIPMTKRELVNFGGKETVTLVDAHALKIKCHGLAQGIHSVKDLVQLQVRKEKAAPLSKSSAFSKFSGLSMSTSLPSLDSLGFDYSFDSTLSPSRHRYEDRERRAQMKRKIISSEDTVRRLNSMRCPPQRLPHAYNVFEFCAPQSRGDWEATDGLIQKKTLAAREQDNFPRRRRMTPNDAEATIDPRKFSQVEVQSPGGTMQVELVPIVERKVSPEVAARVRKLWLAARGFIRLLTCVFAHRRRLSSVVLVARFLNQLGEWSRIKKACRRYVGTVVQLQQTSKAFLGTRHARCEIMMKEFRKKEDRYLVNFVTLWGHKAVEAGENEKKDGHHHGQSGEWMSAEEKRKGDKHKATHFGDIKKHDQTTNYMKNNYNWQGLRIPEETLKPLLCRYYMVLLMKRLRYRETMRQTVETAVKNQKELVQFLKKFNYDCHNEAPTVVEEVEVIDMSQAEFWHMTEDTIIELICYAAESLRNDPKFMQHPINKNEWLPEEDYDKYCRPPRRMPDADRAPLIAILTDPKDPKNIVSGMTMARPGNTLAQMAKRQARQQQQQQAAKRQSEAAATLAAGIAASNAPAIRRKSVASETSSEKAPDADLDEALLLTPRLRDIVTQGRAEWVASPQDPDSRLEPINDLAAIWDTKS